jgi:hypothetical protein
LPLWAMFRLSNLSSSHGTPKPSPGGAGHASGPPTQQTAVMGNNGHLNSAGNPRALGLWVT